MDAMIVWRDIIERVLNEYTAIPYAHGDIECEAVFDRQRDRYMLVSIGWNGDRRVHYTLVHVELRGGRVWIQYDGTETGIAVELVSAGIAKDQIVLGFREPAVRPYTGYAA